MRLSNLMKTNQPPYMSVLGTASLHDAQLSISPLFDRDNFLYKPPLPFIPCITANLLSGLGLKLCIPVLVFAEELKQELLLLKIPKLPIGTVLVESWPKPSNSHFPPCQPHGVK